MSVLAIGAGVALGSLTAVSAFYVAYEQVWAGSQTKNSYVYDTDECFGYLENWHHWATTNLYGYSGSADASTYSEHDGGYTGPWALYWGASYMWDSFGSLYARYVTPGAWSYTGYDIPGSPYRNFQFSPGYPFYLEMYITDSSASVGCTIVSYVSFSPY